MCMASTDKMPCVLEIGVCTACMYTVDREIFAVNFLSMTFSDEN